MGVFPLGKMFEDNGELRIALKMASLLGSCEKNTDCLQDFGF